MFFKKTLAERRAREAQKVADKQAGILDGLGNDFIQAQAQDDAAVKFLQLETLCEKIDQQIINSKKEGRNPGNRPWTSTIIPFGFGVVMVVGAVVGGGFLPGFVDLLMAVVGFGGASYLSFRSVEQDRKRAEIRDKPLFVGLDELRQQTAAAAEHVLTNRIEAIADSPSCEAVSEKAPRLRAHVAAVFAKRLAGRPEIPQRTRRKGGLNL